MKWIKLDGLAGVGSNWGIGLVMLLTGFLLYITLLAGASPAQVGSLNIVELMWLREQLLN